MSGFSKLVPEIVQSSIWNESAEVRVVWITMLAVKDENGYVRGNTQTLSRIANVPLDKTEEALTKFQQPDPSSHTPDNEGRRIQQAPGGYIVLNHDAYRLHDSIQRERTKERVRKFRNKDKSKPCNVTVALPSVSVSASASVSGGGKSTSKFTKPVPREVEEYAKTIGFNLDGNAFVDYYESKGWVIGKSPMKDWKSTVRTWKRNNHVYSSGNLGPSNQPLPKRKPVAEVIKDAV